MLQEVRPLRGRHLDAGEHTAVVRAMVAVVEQADIPARADRLQELQQRSGALGKFEAVQQLVREAAGFAVTDMTGDEMAKLHVRYMVGGHARGIANELLYRFEFPERPGALLKFLQAIGSRWNISLFHYRNHGSDYGRVLAGIQVPPAERADFLEHLNELHYAYVEETANPAYRMFLGS